MSTRKLVQPYFPIPPKEYSSGYMAEIVRSFSIFLQQSINPGEGRATNFTMTTLANNDSGLETGALFAQNGFIKITRLNVASPAGFSVTASVGSVTVTTG
jgi:hypothetical protein|tara:strand:- start:2930 stop:3229 length:300 start_codon:yes stop_codon:yes gene_type:complete